MSSFDDYYNGFYKELAELDEKGNSFSKIESMLPSLTGCETFMDIGCGHGGVSYPLIERGFSVSAIEINEDAIKNLTKKGFTVFKKDLSQPLNITKKFNVVMILDVLEHLFDPYALLQQATKITHKNNYLIVSIPLYFDIFDRLKILFTGSVISIDNLCYGRENYRKFRSYNYDHIRFFRPNDIIEMGESLGLVVDKVEYGVLGYGGQNRFLGLLFRVVANKYTVKINPNLFAHSMKIRWKKV